jgi:hypothetical protein
MNEIINKVASSGLLTVTMDEFYPLGERILIDIKDQLWQGIALREKDFRAYIDTNDWKKYSNKYVAVTCSEDAIIPTWAYMLVSSALQPYAKRVVFGNIQLLDTLLCIEEIGKIDIDKFKDARIVIKGCGDFPIPEAAYIEMVSRLKPIVKSIMFGEPCSTVPVYKRK